MTDCAFDFCLVNKSRKPPWFATRQWANTRVVAEDDDVLLLSKWTRTRTCGALFAHNHRNEEGISQ